MMMPCARVLRRRRSSGMRIRSSSAGVGSGDHPGGRLRFLSLLFRLAFCFVVRFMNRGGYKDDLA